MSLTIGERFVKEKLEKIGAKVYRGGWPDFFVIMDDAALFLEVKGFGDHLRESQKRLHRALKDAGFFVKVVSTAKAGWESDLECWSKGEEPEVLPLYENTMTFAEINNRHIMLLIHAGASSEILAPFRYEQKKT